MFRSLVSSDGSYVRPREVMSDVSHEYHFYGLSYLDALGTY